MQLVAKYRKRAKDCRALAARLSNPADKKRLEYRAEAWAKMADLRERNLQAKTSRHRHQPANKISDEREAARPDSFS